MNSVDEKLSLTAWTFEKNHKIFISLVLKILNLKFRYFIVGLLEHHHYIFKLILYVSFDSFQLYFHII